MSVFKTYDIRGIYGREIDKDLAYLLGRAFPRFAAMRTCMVAHDAREYSADLYDRLVEGLLDQGVDVGGLGLTSTPALHHAQQHTGMDAAVMVTASHNPPRYHGFKLFDGHGGPVGADNGLREIEAVVEGLRKGGDIPVVSRGRLSRPEVTDAYIDFLVSASSADTSGLKVVVDCSHGSSGGVFRALVHGLGLTAWVINGAPDGLFPNHGPNPLEEESRAYIAAEVLRMGADFGALLDGDGDRVIFVDEGGRAIENYFVSALIAEELLARQPGVAVVHDLISSRVLPERISELGGRPVISRVGYTFIYQAMVASGAVFGSETSGHVYFRTADGHITESAAYAMVMLMNVLASRKEPLSRLVEPLSRRYAQAPETNVEVEDREEAMRRVEEAHRSAITDSLDGISVSYPDYWFNLRPSNTEPILRLRLEARSKETALARTAELVRRIQGH